MKQNNKYEKSSKIIKNSIYLLRLIYKSSKQLFIITILAVVAEFCFSFFNLLFTKKLVEDITSGETFQTVCVVILVWCLVYLILRFIILSIDNYFRPVYTKILLQKMQKYLYDKAASVDLECYDNSDYYNEYIWVTNNNGEMVTSASNTIGAFLGYVLQISGVISIVVLIDPSLSVVTFISVALTIWIAAYIERNKMAFRKECVQDEKKKNYIERVFYLKDSAKDLRLTNLKNKLMSNYDEAYDGILHTIKKYVGKITIVSFLSTFGFRYFINTFAIYVYFSYKLIVTKTIDISEFVVINKAMVDLYLLLNRWSDQINKLYKNSLYVDSMKKFLNNEPKIKSVSNPKTVNLQDGFELEFRNVSFTYPGENKSTLENISFKIHEKETIAIVGYNGAGKTTLVKLMLRLYDVNEGEILLNGINIKEYDLKQYREIFSTVFQDFNLYALSLGENIKMDQVNEKNKNNILESIKAVDFMQKYKSFSNGLNTQLTREFDEEGVLLSGGEMQKVAIARVFAKKSDIFILDEPSAALDPVAEYDINNNIACYSNKHTIVLISHRLTATKMANQIIIIEKGKIIERGTHKELLKQDGKYAYMYKLQAMPYLDSDIQMVE